MDGYWWHWSVVWPERFSRWASEGSKQAAADAATTAWWSLMAETEAAWAEHQRGDAFFDHLLETGVADYEQLGLRSMSRDELLRVMRRLIDRWRGAAADLRMEPVVAVLSAELNRRSRGSPKQVRPRHSR